jgi:hypothetical protein
MGGNTVFGNGNVGLNQSIPTSKLHINGGVDASLTSAGFMQIGSTTGQNIVFDDNEIIARNNSAISTLFLQNSGGKTLVGENLEVNGEFEGAVKFQKHLVQIGSGLSEYTLNIGNRTFIEIGNLSNGVDMTLTNGEAPGQILILTGAPSSSVILLRDSPINNVNLPENGLIFQNRVYTLIWTGDIWQELSRSHN